MTPGYETRSAEVGRALQTAVAADPALAVSVVGIGIDALSTMLINSPDQLPSMGGWVDLIDGVYRYVMDGDRSPTVDTLLGGSLDVGTPG